MLIIIVIRFHNICTITELFFVANFVFEMFYDGYRFQFFGCIFSQYIENDLIFSYEVPQST